MGTVIRLIRGEASAVATPAGTARRRVRATSSADRRRKAALAVYFGLLVGAAAADGLWASLPFLLLFASGFGYTSALTLLQARDRDAPRGG